MHLSREGSPILMENRRKLRTDEHRSYKNSLMRFTLKWRLIDDFSVYACDMVRAKRR
jgi:hypothetical protein